LTFVYGVWEFGEFGTEYLGARWDPRAVDNFVDKVDKWSLRSLGVWGKSRITPFILPLVRDTSSRILRITTSPSNKSYARIVVKTLLVSYPTVPQKEK